VETSSQGGIFSESEDIELKSQFGDSLSRQTLCCFP